MAVLCGVDGSAGSDAALRWAAGEAAAFGMPLRLIHATPPGGQGAGRAVIERARRSVLREYPALTVHTETSVDNPRAALSTGGVEVVVVGRRGSGGFPQLSVGSAAVGAASEGAAPVVVVPVGPLPEVETVLVAVDTQAPDLAALGYAFERAHAWARPLRVLTAWDKVVFAEAGDISQVWNAHQEATVTALADLLLPWAAAYPDVLVEPDVQHGHPAGVILEQQHDAGLVVVGRGRTRGSLGAITAAVLQLAQVPVVVVPAEDALSPVNSMR